MTLNLRFNKILITSFALLLIASNCFAQNKVDLELKVQTAAKSVRGGGSFTYTVTVKNVGSVKATRVLLKQDEEGLVSFVSYVPGKGDCVVSDFERRVQRRLHCKLGDLEAGETILISIEAKVQDFGDVSMIGDDGKLIERENAGESEKNSRALLKAIMNSPIFDSLADRSKPNSVGHISVSGEEAEDNQENNSNTINIKLLPSKNIPPRVKIISPESEAVFTRSSKKILPVTFKIKAFDPDGSIEKVSVNTQQFYISVEYPENKYVIDGVKYSIKEVEENKPRFQKYFGGDAVKSDKDTYTFTLENPRYGINQIFIDAVDDGGRIESTSIRFTVKGDNSIEFTKPLNNSVIKPHSDVVLEVKTTLNDAKSAKWQLIGSVSPAENIFMNQISQTGNVFRHQYVVKNATTGRYNYQILLMEDTEAFTYSEDVSFIVTEKPTVKITCPKKTAVFEEGEEIPINVEAADADGRIEKIAVSVNGDYGIFSWKTDGYLKNGYLFGLRKGTYKVIAKVEDDLQVETESEPLTIVVK